MTSYLIDDFARRVPAAQNLDPACIFCKIVSGEAACHKVHEDEHLMAFLDIQPIRHGHVLVIPKTHVKRLSDLSPELAAKLGAAISRIADALCKGEYISTTLGITGLNVVCNQEYAQLVGLVSYHIVPAPSLSNGGAGEIDPKGKAMLPNAIFFRELHSRGVLEDSDGTELSKTIKCRL
ncbi:scavenger mRNA decapping enzyme carboxy-term-binding protein [Ceratobasidium sp. AG-Ba]|nr:scavenger mRNA decapping enzyme carboxy-term-binding protein [Ceratobasidium sp. AG-Ba]